MEALSVTILYMASGLFIGLGAYILQGLLAPRRQVSAEGQIPYECGESPIGSAWQGWRWPFLRLAALLLLLEAEVLFALPWVWVQRTLDTRLALMELGLLTLPIAAAYIYLWRGGWLLPHLSRPLARSSLPASYQALQERLHYLNKLSRRVEP